MTDKRSNPPGPTPAARLHGWDDEKVYFWSPQTGEKCVSDELELLQELLGVCARYFAAAPEKPGP